MMRWTVAFAALIVGCGGGGTTDAGLDAAARDVGVSDASHDDGVDASTVTGDGTIVPLYTDPSDATWTSLVAAAHAHPTVHVVAVINPNSGPTPTADAAYTSGMASLRAAGITVVGYVATGYGARAETAIDDDIDLYHSEYPTLDGIFFDEAAIYEPGHEALYGAVAAHARVDGFAFLVANPGTTPLDAYAALFDVALVYESDGAPTRASLDAFAATRTHCGIIPYAVATLDPAYVASIRPDVAWIYLTDDDLPNPWDSLPSYLDPLLSALE